MMGAELPHADAGRPTISGIEEDWAEYRLNDFQAAFVEAFAELTGEWRDRPWAVPSWWCEGPLICVTTREGEEWGLFLGDDGVHGNRVHNQLYYIDRPSIHALATRGEPGRVAADAAAWFARLPGVVSRS